MKTDELSFINRQLAGMLHAGIPLEGALRKLCEDMQRGGLRTELEQLEADLAQGVPLREAITRRKLPELYQRTIQAGIQGNDLPAVLTMLADYYQRVHVLKTRLKAMLVYPFIVLIVSLAVTLTLTIFYGFLSNWSAGTLWNPYFDLLGPGRDLPDFTQFIFTIRGLAVVLPPLLIGTMFAALLMFSFMPTLRRWALTRVPGFREAQLARLAASLGLLLRGGTSLGDAVALLENLEHETLLGRELARWKTRLAEGNRKFSELAAGSRYVPPLFYWLVASEGEDCPAGLAQAADVYQARAAHRAEMALYSVLPISILGLGLVVGFQVFMIMQMALGGFLPLMMLE